MNLQQDQQPQTSPTYKPGTDIIVELHGKKVAGEVVSDISANGEIGVRVDGVEVNCHESQVTGYLGSLAHLGLLQNVVAAQMRLWEAMGALEKATAPDGEYSDVANNKSIDYFHSLASALHEPEEAFIHVSAEHLKKVLELAKL